jgi:hypothetical protein
LSYALHPSWASYYTWSFQAASDTKNAERDRVVIQAGVPVPVKLETSLQDFLAHFADSLPSADREPFLPAFQHTVAAGVLLTVNLPSDCATCHHWRTRRSLVLSWDLGEVVIFISKATCRDPVAAWRKLTLGLTSAQHQRQALGFDTGPVFGYSTYTTLLRMYCWNSGKSYA